MIPLRSRRPPHAPSTGPEHGKRSSKPRSQRTSPGATTKRPCCSPSVHLALGQALVDEGRLTLAHQHYSDALRLAPEGAQAQLCLGNLYEIQGDLVEAEASFRAAMAMRPDSALPIARLAAHLGAKLPDEDFVLLEQRLDDPTVEGDARARLLFAMAHVLDEREEYGRAAGGAAKRTSSRSSARMACE